MKTLIDNWAKDYHCFVVVIRDDNTLKTIDYDDLFDTCGDAIEFSREQLERLRNVSPGGRWQARVILESSTRILLME
jgi:hypothetical protein